MKVKMIEGLTAQKVTAELNNFLKRARRLSLMSRSPKARMGEMA